MEKSIHKRILSDHFTDQTTELNYYVDKVLRTVRIRRASNRYCCSGFQGRGRCGLRRTKQNKNQNYRISSLLQKWNVHVWYLPKTSPLFPAAGPVFRWHGLHELSQHQYEINGYNKIENSACGITEREGNHACHLIVLCVDMSVDRFHPAVQVSTNKCKVQDQCNNYDIRQGKRLHVTEDTLGRHYAIQSPTHSSCSAFSSQRVTLLLGPRSPSPREWTSKQFTNMHPTSQQRGRLVTYHWCGYTLFISSVLKHFQYMNYRTSLW